MRVPLRGVALFPLLALVGLVAVACGDDDGDPNSRDLRIIVVTHGSASDPFWSVVANGVTRAQADLGIRVEYQRPEAFDLAGMARRLDQAADSKPDAIVLSVPDASALGPSVRAAIQAGIPLVSINSGSDVYDTLGILAHIGQTEYEAGLGAGERMAQAGVRNALCVIHEAGNAGLDLRCRGFGDGLGGASRVTTVSIDLADPGASRAAIEGALSADRSIDGVLTLGPAAAAAGIAAVEASGRAAGVKVATFDLSEEVLGALRDDRLLFAIDQQPYLQGYLGVLIAAQFVRYGLLPGGGHPILTGPRFVLPEDVDLVTELTAEGIR